MKLTTLCYIENDRGEYLMLHRTKKENDLNHGKWIGVGGKFEDGETPEECLLREVYEETGLTLTDYLFTAKAPAGTPKECPEGVLAWVPKEDVPDLRLWEGDRIFLKELLEHEHVFSLKLSYKGDTLTDSSLIRYSEKN